MNDVIIFISGEVLLLLLILVVAGISWIIDNLLWILLFAVVVNLIIPLLIYWKPELVVAAVIAFLVIGLIAYLICAGVDQAKINDHEITLYRATGTCTFFDEAHETIAIPKGAIFVIFGHPEQQSKEPQYIGKATICYWYYEGTVYNSTVSNLAEVYKWQGVNWNREEVGTTTYKEIMQGNWWVYE